MALAQHVWPGLSLALLVFSGAAHATPRRGARVVWARGEGADACVGALGLAEDVKSRLGWNPFALPLTIEVEGIVRRTPSGFRAELAYRSPEGKLVGKRHLESKADDCRSLGEAVAVAITVAIDPDVSGNAPPPVEEIPPEAPPPVVAPLPREGPARVRVMLGVGTSAGLVPGVSAAPSLRAGVAISARIEAGIGATYLVPTREGPYGFGLAIAEARGCVLPWGARGLLRLSSKPMARTPWNSTRYRNARTRASA